MVLLPTLTPPTDSTANLLNSALDGMGLLTVALSLTLLAKVTDLTLALPSAGGS